ncbi:MAG: zinc ribbon domain-containing protein [Firmicutes bacterium]|nr:zinc ribbon domain-containing protein [Bacillota bacterium]
MKIFCYECGESMSDSAESCPKCGAVNIKRVVPPQMRKPVAPPMQPQAQAAAAPVKKASKPLVFVFVVAIVAFCVIAAQMFEALAGMPALMFVGDLISDYKGFWPDDETEALYNAVFACGLIQMIALILLFCILAMNLVFVIMARNKNFAFKAAAAKAVTVLIVISMLLLAVVATMTIIVYAMFTSYMYMVMLEGSLVGAALLEGLESAAEMDPAAFAQEMTAVCGLIAILIPTLIKALAYKKELQASMPYYEQPMMYAPSPPQPMYGNQNPGGEM